LARASFFRKRYFKMKTLSEISETLKDNKVFLRENYRVKNIGIFGSYLRGEDNKGSDLDILVDFEAPVTLIEFISLENYLSDLLGVSVDLVMKSALRPRIGENILREVVFV
jgi:predicted nucleotidyltransferase